MSASNIRRRLQLCSDLMSMLGALSDERLEQLVREIAREADARLREFSRPRLVIDNTRQEAETKPPRRPPSS